jgi:hypothetical protein
VSFVDKKEKFADEKKIVPLMPVFGLVFIIDRLWIFGYGK